MTKAFEVLGPDREGDDTYGTKPESDQSAQYACACGGKVFTAHFVPGGYETSIRCISCLGFYVIHEG